MPETLPTPTARLIVYALADYRLRSATDLKALTGTASDAPLRSALKLLQAIGKVVKVNVSPTAHYRLAPEPWSDSRESDTEDEAAHARYRRLHDAWTRYPESLTPAAWEELGEPAQADVAEAKLIAAVEAADAILLDKYEELAGRATWSEVSEAESEAATAPLVAAHNAASIALGVARAERAYRAGVRVAEKAAAARLQANINALYAQLETAPEQQASQPVETAA